MYPCNVEIKNTPVILHRWLIITQQRLRETNNLNSRLYILNRFSLNLCLYIKIPSFWNLTMQYIVYGYEELNIIGKTNGKLKLS